MKMNNFFQLSVRQTNFFENWSYFPFRLRQIQQNGYNDYGIISIFNTYEIELNLFSIEIKKKTRRHSSNSSLTVYAVYLRTSFSAVPIPVPFQFTIHNNPQLHTTTIYLVVISETIISSTSFRFQILFFFNFVDGQQFSLFVDVFNIFFFDQVFSWFFLDLIFDSFFLD